MPYIPPALDCADKRVAAIIHQFTDGPLKEAHYLLAARHFHTPLSHFGFSAVIMTLLAVAATANLRHFKPKANEAPRGADKERFLNCVRTYFPWENVGIKDGEYRSPAEQREAAVTALYDELRNPLIHAGGVTGKGLNPKTKRPFSQIQISHTLPGLATYENNEQVIAEYSQYDTLYGQLFIEFDYAKVTIHAKPLYWAVRKTIENAAADPDVQVDIAKNHGIV